MAIILSLLWSSYTKDKSRVSVFNGRTCAMVRPVCSIIWLLVLLKSRRLTTSCLLWRRCPACWCPTPAATSQKPKWPISSHRSTMIDTMLKPYSLCCRLSLLICLSLQLFWHPPFCWKLLAIHYGLCKGMVGWVANLLRYTVLVGNIGPCVDVARRVRSSSCNAVQILNDCTACTLPMIIMMYQSPDLTGFSKVWVTRHMIKSHDRDWLHI